MIEVPGDVVVLTGIPVANAFNIAYAARIGVPVTELPFPPPYRDSVQDTCVIHFGLVWLGPELTARRERQRLQGGDADRGMPLVRRASLRSRHPWWSSRAETVQQAV